MMDKQSKKIRENGLSVTFWGTRGSIATPGRETLVYGGNTSCLEVEIARDDHKAFFIVDAGTGLRALGESRPWRAGDVVHLLLTHLHHDHVIGLPFFKAVYTKGLKLHIWCGNLDGESPEAQLDRMFSPPLFPFRLQEVAARIVFHGFRAGETIDVAGEPVLTHPLRHPSGATGYRFGRAPGDLAVITDIEHEPGGPEPGLVAFCRGAGTVVYDTMLQESEYGTCQGWGHSTSGEAVKLMQAAGARQLIGFHHGPGQTDAVLAVREADMQALWPRSLMAREGQTVNCSTSSSLEPETARVLSV
jgi:phosphoribosyl 1,2-cyclic phosphodiesterase